MSSTSAATAKLTKKQKKALAFRERHTKTKSKATDVEEENDVPVMEDQDVAEAEVQDSRLEGKEGGADGSAKVGKSSKKRKREDDAEGEAEKAKKSPSAKKKRKGGDEVVQSVVVQEGEGEAGGTETKVKKSVKQQRFILFVGNLKYTTSKEAIHEHFKLCEPPPTVRLMTPKATTPGRPVTKSKGCAFLEFTAKPGLQQALKLHHSTLDGRMINVELTAGGGGKSETRTAKLKERNKELHEQRKKKIEKQKSSHDVEAEVRDLERPQRYSATSGVDQALSKKRTWSISDEKDAETKSKTKKRAKRPPKALGTGVNAIPVG